MQLPDCERVAEISALTLPEGWSYQEICKVLQYDYNVYYIAWDTLQEDVVGFAGIMVIAEDSELLNIAVDPQYQHKGIGTLLMDKIVEESWKHGADRILLEVRSSNTMAQRLYKQYCFAMIGKRKNYYSNPTEDAWIMSLDRIR